MRSKSSPAPFTLTDAAVAHFESQLARREGSWGIRIDLRTTGCSGHAYVIEFFDEIHCQGFFEDVHPVVVRGINFAVSNAVETLVSGMEIDYVKDGVNEGIAFNNPNEKAKCGCGESVSF